ncbi:MAG: hypothetical protein MZU79_09300 [Anaerotruncus sp.]|nr:hypothetical protein [Anaerotruncus sp.]
MEALVKGLTQELLDLKSVAMKMSKQTEERSRQELKRADRLSQGAAVTRPQMPRVHPPGGSTVVMRKGARQPDAPAAPRRTRDGHDHAAGRDHET